MQSLAAVSARKHMPKDRGDEVAVQPRSCFRPRRFPERHRRGDGGLKPQSRQRGEQLQMEAYEGVRNRQRHILFHAFWMIEAQQERHQRTPVMSDDPCALQPKFVEQRHKIRHQLVRLVSVSWSVRPPGAAQIGTDHPVTLGEHPDELPPRPPVLREAVQEEQWLPLACLGDVHPEARQLHEAVLHPGQFGQRPHRLTLPM